jgi:nucleoside-diphosphate-sugar epimerase
MNYAEHDLSAERILITGGGGFIGHHLAKAFREASAQVTVVDNLSHNNLGDFWSDAKPLPPLRREAYLRFLNERLDILKHSGCQMLNVNSEDQASLEAVFDKVQPTRVYHLAAVANANTSNKEPDLAFGTSLITLKNTLECVRKRTDTIKQLVWLSSSMIYGDFPPEGVTETTAVHPKGVYAALKLAGESMIIAYHQIYNVQYTIVRPSALYGPRCVSRRVTSIFVENAIEGSALRIEGDGEEKLDFTNINDLVQGLFLVAIRPAALNEIFNLTYGEERSVNQLVDILRTQFPGLKVERIPRDSFRPMRGTLKIDKARRLLGYNPEYPLERGIPDLVEWYSQALKLGARV